MKPFKILLAFSLMFIMSATFTSCEKENPQPQQNQNNPPPNPTSTTMDVIMLHTNGDFITTYVVNDSTGLVFTKSTFPVSTDLCTEASVPYMVPQRYNVYTVYGLKPDSTTHTIGTFVLNLTNPPTISIESVVDISMPPDNYYLQVGMCPNNKLLIQY